jgi:hypothetical protein
MSNVVDNLEASVNTGLYPRTAARGLQAVKGARTSADDA